MTCLGLRRTGQLLEWSTTLSHAFSFKQVLNSLCIFGTALLGVEELEVIESAECRCVLRSQCLLITSQCTVVHSLRVFETALIDVESSEVVDGGERGCVLGSPSLLKTGQCTVVHSLRVF